MAIRPTQASTYSQVKHGLLLNFSKLAHAQQQVATGKRIIKPSDDPIGSALALSYRRSIAGSERFRESIQSGRTMVDTAVSGLQDVSGIYSEARALLVQGMNGVLSEKDRVLLAGEIRLIREQLLDISNTQTAGRYLFAGTETGSEPYFESVVNGISVVQYAGNDQAQELLVGQGNTLLSTIPGSEVFSREQRTGTRFAGLTGLATGVSADQGSGYQYLDVRHDSTTGALGAGLAFVSGGSQDTIMGDHNLVVDGAAGTVQLDSGQVVRIPLPTDPEVADFVVTSEGGAELHLDFTGFTGGNLTTTVRGEGSISIDGSNYVPLTLTETDLELIEPASGAVVHVDATAVHRAGKELVTFSGAVSGFDTLQGIVDDLENIHGLSGAELRDRFALWIDELDRNHDNVLVSTGTLGGRSQRLTRMADGLLESEIQVRGLLSNVEDADFSQVVLDMTRSEQTLQLAQATSVRLLNTSLMNFLR
jgi:flagellar hook-associated protein 3 FlgL